MLQQSFCDKFVNDTPFYRLPDDIIVYILDELQMMLLSEGRLNNWAVIMTVSRRLWMAAIEAAQLWSRLVVSADDWLGSLDGQGRGRKWLDLCLLRGGDYPAELHIDSSGTLFRWNPAALYKISSLAPRTRFLFITHVGAVRNDTTMYPVTQSQNWLAQPWSYVSHMSLTVESYRILQDVPCPPCLRHLTIRALHLCKEAKWPLRYYLSKLPYLNSLTFVDISGSLEEHIIPLLSESLPSSVAVSLQGSARAVASILSNYLGHYTTIDVVPERYMDRASMFFITEQVLKHIARIRRERPGLCFDVVVGDHHHDWLMGDNESVWLGVTSVDQSSSKGSANPFHYSWMCKISSLPKILGAARSIEFCQYTRFLDDVLGIASFVRPTIQLLRFTHWRWRPNDEQAVLTGIDKYLMARKVRGNPLARLDISFQSGTVLQLSEPASRWIQNQMVDTISVAVQVSGQPLNHDTVVYNARTCETGPRMVAL